MIPSGKILKDVCARVGLPRGTCCPLPLNNSHHPGSPTLTPHQPLGTENPRAAVLTQRVSRKQGEVSLGFFLLTETHQMALGQTVAGKAVD